MILVPMAIPVCCTKYMLIYTLPHTNKIHQGLSGSVTFLNVNSIFHAIVKACKLHILKVVTLLGGVRTNKLSYEWQDLHHIIVRAPTFSCFDPSVVCSVSCG